MNKSFFSSAYELIDTVFTNGIRPLIVEKENYAYLHDPVFDVKRNRVVAETLKAIVHSNLKIDKRVIGKFIHFLERNQNKDGSWNEIHPSYNQPSALITSIVGEALLVINKEHSDKKLEKMIHDAAEFVLSQEKSSGFFLKSKKYDADHLNVDAACGAFLASYGKMFSDETALKSAKQSAKHICDNQFSNGSYPYTIDKGSYQQLLNVPCIHYQGVTLYYLSKINEVLKERWLEESMKRGVEWLVGVQRADGRFDWSKSGLMFAYYLTGAYAFAFSSFMYASRWDDKYQENARLCLGLLKKNRNDLFLRWEKNLLITLPFEVPATLKTALIGKYSTKHNMFRFGYGMYRQMARRRYSTDVDDKLFKSLTKLFNVKTSTVESFSNYPDLFMTSEIMDCLSYRGLNKVI